MTRRKVDVIGLIYRHNDPKEYGYICPHCSQRYGNKSALGYVDVVRCSRCPSLAAVEATMNLKKISLKKMSKLNARD